MTRGLGEQEQAAAADREAGQRAAELGAILTSVADGVVVYGSEGEVLRMNGAAEAILGMPLHEFAALRRSDERAGELGCRDAEGAPLAPERTPIRRALGGEPVRDLELLMETPAGGQTWIRLTAHPVRLPSGEVVGVVATFMDVTERKRTEAALGASEERFRSVAEQMTEGLVIFDAAGTVTFQNPASVQIHAARLSEHRRKLDQLRVNWNVRTYPEGSLVPPDQWAIPRILRGERVQNERFFVDCVEDPERSFVGIYSGRPVFGDDGKLAYGFLTIQQITEQARAESALSRLNETLRDADARKNDFLAVLSHELRNPLTPIRNSLYILERAAPGGEQSKRALAVIDRQVRQMARLIDDLLDVTRISRGKTRLDREPLELNDVVRGTGEDMRALFRSNDIDFAITIASRRLRVFADRTRLSQMVGNLLGNAAKFTPSRGTVALSLESADGTAVIRVRDSGVGIEPELLKRLFEPFMQADKTLDRSRGGLGLGLALVKALAELHGGSVTARSDGPGTGAEFTIRLPLETKSVAAERGPAGRVGSKGRRVLLVEDNADAAESLKLALALEGHEVETAADGLEGLEKARVFLPDIVVCDIGLPGIDGFEVARRMRADETLRSACLVALSGYATPEDVTKSREAGFVRHLAKPPDLNLLGIILLESCVAKETSPDGTRA